MTEEEDIWDKEIEVRESKGLLDPEVEYTWELYERLYRKDVIFAKEAPAEVRGKTLSDLDQDEQQEINPKWCADIVELHFKTIDEGVDVQLKESAWMSDVLTLNTDNPEYQSRLATLIQKMGGTLEEEQKITLGEYFPVGLQFKAHPQAQRKDGKETGYHELDLATIRAASKKKEQSKVAKADVTDEQRAEIKALMSTMKNPAKDDVMKELISSEKAHLMGAFITMDVAGEFKWK